MKLSYTLSNGHSIEISKKIMEGEEAIFVELFNGSTIIKYDNTENLDEIIKDVEKNFLKHLINEAVLKYLTRDYANLL